MCFMTKILYSPDHVNASRCWYYDTCRVGKTHNGVEISGTSILTCMTKLLYSPDRVNVSRCRSYAICWGRQTYNRVDIGGVIT